MSWLVIVALLVVFVVRMGFSMMTRRRLRVGADTGVPAPRAQSATAVDAPTVALRDASAPAAPVDGGLAPVASATTVPETQISPDLEGRVQALMNTGFEAGAVRLLCDELGMGIYEARQTVRALAGLPTG
jgi:hypothetical protein